jgi:uncharacterized SAM-binding protein YcdF (DUF218 family)
MRKLFLIAALAAGLPASVYVISLAQEIEEQSNLDEAQKADVIVILGAAEYDGRPSPVLRARLDHALDLHRRGYAPRFFTTGGAGGDPQFTEGEVSRDYLVRNGIPAESIIVESEGGSTVHSVTAVSEVMRRMGLGSAIVVSDGYHVFRAKRILEYQGVTVFGSPRQTRNRGGLLREKWLYLRQALAYLLWRVGINL